MTNNYTDKGGGFLKSDYLEIFYHDIFVNELFHRKGEKKIIVLKVLLGWLMAMLILSAGETKRE